MGSVDKRAFNGTARTRSARRNNNNWVHNNPAQFAAQRHACPAGGMRGAAPRGGSERAAYAALMLIFPSSAQLTHCRGMQK